MLLPLTDNQRNVFDAYTQYFIDHQYPPTSREVCEVLNKKAISNEVTGCIKKGWLKKLEDIRVRSVMPTDEALERFHSDNRS